MWRWWWWWWCWNNIEACNMHRLRATWILSSVTLHAQPTSVILCGAWVPATASSKGTSLSSTLKKKLRKKLTIDLKYPPKIANNSKPKYIKHEGGKWQFEQVVFKCWKIRKEINCKPVPSVQAGPPPRPVPPYPLPSQQTHTNSLNENSN